MVCCQTSAVNPLSAPLCLSTWNDGQNYINEIPVTINLHAAATEQVCGSLATNCSNMSRSSSLTLSFMWFAVSILLFFADKQPSLFSQSGKGEAKQIKSELKL